MVMDQICGSLKDAARSGEQIRAGTCTSQFVIVWLHKTKGCERENFVMDVKHVGSTRQCKGRRETVKGHFLKKEAQIKKFQSFLWVSILTIFKFYT